MKKTLPRIAILFAAVAFALTPACTKESGDHDHDHDHDHDEHHEHDGHDHGEEGHDDHAAHEDHDHDHGHSHDSIEAGPNGGRILFELEPHVEFLVTEDRKVQIAAVNDDGKLTPITTQTASLMGGSRTNPTKMKFTKVGDVLVSDVAFPEGNDFPVVIQLKGSPDDKAATVKFNLNLADCPTCDYKEYACTCEH
ncbi:MAG: hypothetical protein P1U86_04195 [Verrucomicrobiales bacterium]|nr:hypothetical protein [Verrucomicrobiales bacterium]